jgi:hypothetical protein
MTAETDLIQRAATMSIEEAVEWLALIAEAEES